MVAVSKQGVPADIEEEVTAETDTVKEVVVKVGNKLKDMGTRMKEEEAVTNTMKGEHKLNDLDQDEEKTDKEINHGRTEELFKGGKYNSLDSV